MKIKGKIEYRYNCTPTSNERYYTLDFKNLLGLLWALFKIARKKCDKIYIYFNNKPNQL